MFVEGGRDERFEISVRDESIMTTLSNDNEELFMRRGNVLRLTKEAFESPFLRNGA